jgi:hypothetical protein
MPANHIARTLGSSREFTTSGGYATYNLTMTCPYMYLPSTLPILVPMDAIHASPVLHVLALSVLSERPS